MNDVGPGKKHIQQGCCGLRLPISLGWVQGGSSHQISMFFGMVPLGQ